MPQKPGTKPFAISETSKAGRLLGRGLVNHPQRQGLSTQAPARWQGRGSHLAQLGATRWDARETLSAPGNTVGVPLPGSSGVCESRASPLECNPRCFTCWDAILILNLESSWDTTPGTPAVMDWIASLPNSYVLTVFGGRTFKEVIKASL